MIMFKYFEIKIGTQSLKILIEDLAELVSSLTSMFSPVKILQRILLSSSKTSVIHLLWFSMLKNSLVSELAVGAALLPIENPTYITSRVPSSLLQNNGVPDTPLKIFKKYIDYKEVKNSKKIFCKIKILRNF